MYIESVDYLVKHKNQYSNQNITNIEKIYKAIMITSVIEKRSYFSQIFKLFQVNQSFNLQQETSVFIVI